MALTKVLRRAKLTRPTLSRPLMGVTPVPTPLPCKPPQIGGMGVPLRVSSLRPSPTPPTPPPGNTYLVRVLLQTRTSLPMGLSPLTPSLPARLPRMGLTTIGSSLPLRRSPPFLPQRVTQMGVSLSPSRCYSSRKIWQDSLKSKLEDFNGFKNRMKPYFGKAVEEIPNHLKQVLEKILQTVGELGQLAAHHVALGLKAKVSEYSYYFFVLGVLGIISWIGQVFNLMQEIDTEGHDSDLEELVKDLKEFPHKMALDLLYLQVSCKILREVILTRKELQIEIWKRFETFQRRIEELEDENRVIKGEIEMKLREVTSHADEIEIKLREVTSQADDVKEALAKLKASAELK